MNTNYLLQDLHVAVLDSEIHTYISRLVIDIGIFLFIASGVYSLYANSIHWTAFLFAGLSLFGAGLYLPSYFIGQELFDSGGLSIVLFVYLCGSVISGAILFQVYSIPENYFRLTGYLLLMTVMFSGIVRAEVEEIV